MRADFSDSDSFFANEMESEPEHLRTARGTAEKSAACGAIWRDIVDSLRVKI
jgi:hypothetical protein